MRNYVMSDCGHQLTCLAYTALVRVPIRWDSSGEPELTREDDDDRGAWVKRWRLGCGIGR